jgi:hypothetical protein
MKCWKNILNLKNAGIDLNDGGFEDFEMDETTPGKKYIIFFFNIFS